MRAPQLFPHRGRHRRAPAAHRRRRFDVLPAVLVLAAGTLIGGGTALAAHNSPSVAGRQQHPPDGWTNPGKGHQKHTPIPTPTATSPIHPAASTDPSLCVASDVQAGVSGSQASSQAGFAAYLKSLPCDRIVMPGDLTADGFASEFATFNSWYGDVKAKILPARGNHDARSPLANYTAYWGARVTTNGSPWYSVDVGAWHLVSLDLTGGAVSSAEVTWLANDLAANAGKPTLAFWHKPRYSTGFYGDNAASEPLWQVLAAHGADVVLNGHTHVAQRFAVTRGIREWIDSSAGANLHSGNDTSSLDRAWIVPGPQFGVLRLVLHADSYGWTFTNTSGQVLDSGSATAS